MLFFFLESEPRQRPALLLLFCFVFFHPGDKTKILTLFHLMFLSGDSGCPNTPLLPNSSYSLTSGRYIKPIHLSSGSRCLGGNTASVSHTDDDDLRGRTCVMSRWQWRLFRRNMTRHSMHYYMWCCDLWTVGSKIMISQKLSELLVFTPTRKRKKRTQLIFFANLFVDFKK